MARPRGAARVRVAVGLRRSRQRKFKNGQLRDRRLRTWLELGLLGRAKASGWSAPRRSRRSSASVVVGPDGEGMRLALSDFFFQDTLVSLAGVQDRVQDHASDASISTGRTGPESGAIRVDLDYTTGCNQQFRVDILPDGDDPFDNSTDSSRPCSRRRTAPRPSRARRSTAPTSYCHRAMAARVRGGRHGRRPERRRRRGHAQQRMISLRGAPARAGAPRRSPEARRSQAE